MSRPFRFTSGRCLLTLLLGLAGWLGGVVPASAGNLLVSSIGTDDVKRYNGSTGAFIDTFASGGGLIQPQGLVFGLDGNLYVSSSGTADVKRYNGSTGAFLDTFASGGGLAIPTYLVFSPEAAAVPEPASVVLFGVGLLGALGYGWRRRRRPRWQGSGGNRWLRGR